MGNPYLDQRYRDHDRELLILGMKAPRADTEELLQRYAVTHFLLRSSDLPAMKEASRYFPDEALRVREFVLLAR